MNQYSSIFLQQSYQDAWEEYTCSLSDSTATQWDYVILTASNENQAQTYRVQIDYRLENGFLPSRTHYAVLADPDGKRVGSGGATLNVLRYIAEREQSSRFDDLKILVIHSGGDSKRIPQYSACGKIFSPVPRELPDGRESTLFDELIISVSGVAARMTAGMLVMAGDILMLFNALQIDFCTKGAAALTIKESPQVGQNHGVYKADADGNVGAFLHKRPADELRRVGAADDSGKINIDTGAVILDHHILNDLWHVVGEAKLFSEFVNEQVRLSFYADFLFPMATESTYDDYLKEIPEGEFSSELLACRQILWDVLRPYKIRLMRLSPAAFIHFGTTKEVLKLRNETIDAYNYLGWKRSVHTNIAEPSFAVHNSYISNNAVVGEGSYIEDSIIHSGCRIGKNCVISGLELRDAAVPDDTVLHGLKLRNGRYTVRMYGVVDDPKKAELFGTPIPDSLWTYPIFPVCETQEQAVHAVLKGEVPTERISLRDSFNQADGAALLRYRRWVHERIDVQLFIDHIQKGHTDQEAASVFCHGLTEAARSEMESFADKADLSTRMRVYNALSKCDTERASWYQKTIFASLQSRIIEETFPTIPPSKVFSVCEEKVDIFLPVRVNWAGGWTDTPPYCLEHGGTVLNAAVCLNGVLPIHASVKRLERYEIELACRDNGSSSVFTNLQPLQDLNNPFDQFAIQKAALTALGFMDAASGMPLQSFLKQIGGGFSFVTDVDRIPRGSGLGTSSILAAACVRALAAFFGLSLTDQGVYSAVLCMEQLMSTGGGWQDQVGGLAPGIKLVHAAPGLPQNIYAEPVVLTDQVREELEQRFCLVYTGQRRLARNLLREVVSRYIGNDPDVLRALRTTETTAYKMRDALCSGDLDAFALGMEQQWACGKQLFSGCTNTCIEHIFRVCEDLTAGKTICGAGGGGFLQILLKRGVTRGDLAKRLLEVYADAGIGVWDSSFYYGSTD